MRISCITNGYNHEVQVIAQIFFPNHRFDFVSDIPDTGYACVATVNGQVCTGELYSAGKLLARHTIKEPIENSLKRSVMLALFYAVKEAVDLPVPWGALTGVRPAKQVRLWLEEGYSEAEIKARLSEIYKCRDDKIKLATAVAKAEQKLISRQKKGLCLYIGIPFCTSRCLYCSFITSRKAGEDMQTRYLEALAKDFKNIALTLAEQKQTVNALYIGGGTPTALNAKNLDKLLSATEENFGVFLDNAEYTLEAGRPDSIDSEKLKIIKSYGVNRIAINPQTLNDKTLEIIGRAHTAADFFKAYDLTQAAGFDNINTDVIAGLPGETAEDMENTMLGLKKLSPAHITVHTLAVKRSSRLNEYLGDYQGADYKTVDAMLGLAMEACESAGLSPYYMYRQKNMTGNFENVGYSLPGRECLYNVAMMAETQTVLAAGAGAVTKYVEGTKIWRSINPKDIDTYIVNKGE